MCVKIQELVMRLDQEDFHALAQLVGQVSIVVFQSINVNHSHARMEEDAFHLQISTTVHVCQASQD